MYQLRLDNAVIRVRARFFFERQGAKPTWPLLRPTLRPVRSLAISMRDGRCVSRWSDVLFFEKANRGLLLFG